MVETVLWLVVMVMAIVIYDQRREIKRLTDEANTDKLTGLYNQRAVNEIFADRRYRPGDSLAVVMMDLDHFKSINDTFGHDAGDEVLRKVATALGKNTRACDTVARWGGEEIVLLLPGLAKAKALVVVEKLRKKIEQLTFSDPELTVTASFGVTIVASSDTLSLDSALRKADEALYEAKRSGRNQVCFVE